jgi:hypothetical protein
MDFWAIFLPLIALLAVVIGVTLDSRKKRAKRTAHLGTYPSIDALRPVVDAAKYRAIRDNGGRTGEVQAARALMRDYPGLTLTEAATLARSL